MPDMLVRDLKPETLDYFKRKAREHGRSLQAEVKALLEEAEARDPAEREASWEEVRSFRDSLRGRVHSDSTELIREDRDSDHGHDW